MNWDISCIKIVSVNLHLHKVQVLRIAIYAHFKIVDPVCEEPREDEVPHSLLEELIILYINWQVKSTAKYNWQVKSTAKS